MTRLPNPGSDDGSWGEILNEFLQVEHNSDGTLKSTGSIASKANDSSVVHNSGSETVGGTKTFSSSPVVPSPTLGSQAANKTYVDGVAMSGAAPATGSSLGLVQLSGDLGGTGSVATSPIITDGAVTNSKIANGAISTNKLAAGSVTSNEIADSTITNTDISASAAIARTKLDSSTQTSLGKADTALQAADNLSDLASASTARTNLGLGTAATISSTAGGDLTGTLPSPTVAKIKGITLPAAAPNNNDVLTATSATTTAWSAPAAGVVIDTTASDIAPLGTQAAGAIGKAADAGHVHAMPRLDQVLIPTAVVSLNSQKITNLANGTAATDAAAFGQIPVVGTTTGTYAAGDDSRITGAVQKANNLSDLANAGTARTNLGVAIGTNVQAWDTDLDAYAALSSTGIVNRTGSGTVSTVTTPSGAIVGTTDSQTLTNKHITKRVVVLTDGATIATNIDSGDIFTVTLGGNRTMSNPTGTPTDGQQIMYRITQDGVGTRTITWGAAFRFSADVVSPTLTTTINKTDYVGFQYNSASTTWDCLAVSRGY